MRKGRNSECSDVVRDHVGAALHDRPRPGESEQGDATPGRSAEPDRWMLTGRVEECDDVLSEYIGNMGARPGVTAAAKRSSEPSLRRDVPAMSRGFCVATNMNGSGRGWVTPSTETCASSVSSSSADWVRGVVRLSSSNTTRLAKTGPGRKTSEVMAPSAFIEPGTMDPVTSPGSRSDVPWIRRNEPPTDLAITCASKVLPTPGMSSMRRWPLASNVATATSTTAALPAMTELIVAVRRRATSAAVSAFITIPPGPPPGSLAGSLAGSPAGSQRVAVAGGRSSVVRGGGRVFALFESARLTGS